MTDAWKRIAAALRMSTPAFTALIVIWAVVLFLAPVVDGESGYAVGVIVGLAVTAIGLRALLAVSRPFDIGWLNVPFFTTSRRLGAFYVVVGGLYATSFLVRI